MVGNWVDVGIICTYSVLGIFQTSSGPQGHINLIYCNSMHDLVPVCKK